MSADTPKLSDVDRKTALDHIAIIAEALNADDQAGVDWNAAFTCAKELGTIVSKALPPRPFLKTTFGSAATSEVLPELFGGPPIEPK